jgi:hypothetical protein
MLQFSSFFHCQFYRAEHVFLIFWYPIFPVQVAKYGSQLDLPAESPMESGFQSSSQSQSSVDYRSERYQSVKKVEKRVAKEGVIQGEKEGEIEGEIEGDKFGKFSSPMMMSLHEQINKETLDLDSRREERHPYFQNFISDAKYCFAELKINEVWPPAAGPSRAFQTEYTRENNKLKLRSIKVERTEMKNDTRNEVVEEEVTPRSLAGIKRENMKDVKYEPIKFEKFRSAKTESEKESSRSFASDFMC